MKVIWLTKAMEDRVAIFDYIEPDSPANAIRVDDRLMAAAAMLEQFPELGPRRKGRKGRKLILADIGFNLFYNLRVGRVEITSIERHSRTRS